jgi:hypothetical protein
MVPFELPNVSKSRKSLGGLIALLEFVDCYLGCQEPGHKSQYIVDQLQDMLGHSIPQLIQEGS